MDVVLFAVSSSVNPSVRKLHCQAIKLLPCCCCCCGGGSGGDDGGDSGADGGGVVVVMEVLM